MEKTLYNNYSDNCCAYCNLHNCSMTVKQMRRKECLQKQCYHLEKNESHDFWRHKARIKELRKERKENLCGKIDGNA